ncbi:MAG: hypothetical protein WC792_05840 [Candidatus Micrarchaeia archaeon]|jgi:hypothetical protein
MVVERRNIPFVELAIALLDLAYSVGLQLLQLPMQLLEAGDYALFAAVAILVVFLLI